MIDFPWVFRINVLAVLAATVAYMALGFIWFHRGVFGTRWMQLIGKSEAELRANARPATYAWVTLYALTTSGAMAWIISRSNSWTFWWGAKVGAIVGLGIAVTTLAIDAAFHGRPRPLLWINAGYHLTAMVIVGAILGTWNG